MGAILRLLLLLGVVAAGLLLAIEITSRRRAEGDRRPDSEVPAEVELARLETAATVSPVPPPVDVSTPASATRSAASGTAPLGIAAAIGTVALTGWLLYRLSG